MKSAQVWRHRSPQGLQFGPLALVLLMMLVAVFVGLAVAVLPLQGSVLLGGGTVLLLALGVMAVAPPMTQVPAKALAWGLVIALVLYFVWPRNVFLPIRGLPIKHPQRLFYLLFLAYGVYVFFKCLPARQQLMRALSAVPWLTGLWAAFSVWQFISLLAAKHSLSLVGGWLVETLVVTLLYPLVLMCCPTLRDFQRLFGGLLLAALINCLYALPEALLQRNLFERFITVEMLDPEIARQIIAAKVRGGQFRAQGAFDHPLLLAEFLAVNLPFALVLMLQRGRRLLGLGAVAVLLTGLYLSHSRVAVVAGVLAVSAMALAMIVRGAQQGRRNPWPLVISLFLVPLVVLGGVLATQLVASVAAGTSQMEANSTSVRLQMLYGGLKLIELQPLFGYGPGTAGFVLNFQNTFGVMTLDNYLLAVTLDGGIPALAIYVSLLFVAGWQALRFAVLADIPHVHRLGLITFGALLAFGPIKLVLGTALNNLMLPVWLAGLAALTQTLQQQQVALHQDLSNNR